MRTGRLGDLPEDLRRARARFQAWRQRRQAGERIPASLWDLAVRLVPRHGVNRAAKALGLDYYALKERAEQVATPAPPEAPAFVELPSSVLAGKHCLVELDQDTGTRLRVHLTGYEAGDVAAFARHFWNAD